MKVCLIGGIFGKPDAYQRTVRSTPETVLARELRRRGHEVRTYSHRGPFDFRGFDVVHVHHLSWGAIAAAASAHTSRMIFTPHRQIVTPRQRVAMRYVLTRADATVALSPADAAWQLAHFPVVAGRQEIVPNGIDSSVFTFSTPERPAAGESWRLLFVGQLIPLKGVSLLISALAACAGRFPATLELVYQVAQDESALRAQASALGVTVLFRGALTPEELAGLYRACHVFVLPSLTETLPSVVSEAMFTGRPVVAGDLPGIRDQVGTFGALVAPGSATALAAGLTGVIANYDALRDSAQAASERAVLRYAIGPMVDAHEALYASVRAQPARKSGPDGLVDRSVRGLLPHLVGRIGAG